MIEARFRNGLRATWCRRLLGPAAVSLSAVLVLQSFGQSPVPPHNGRAQDSKAVQESRTADYFIRASLPIIGDIGNVGTFAIEQKTMTSADKIEKTFRMSGHSNPERVRKGQDYGGAFEMIERMPLVGVSGISGSASEDKRDTERSCFGYLGKNGSVKSESVVFHPDCAVSVREDGTEKRVEGDYGSLLSVLEYFFDHEVRIGDIYKSAFILDGYPYIFKCEVSEKTFLAPYQAWAYLIDVTTYDGLRRDSTGALKAIKKKGGIRIWLCKDGEYPNTVLRMKIRYRWYLTLIMELKPQA